MIPKVSINIANGQLGRTTQTSDGVCGLVITGSSNYGAPLRVTSLADAASQGITSAGEPFAYKQIGEFYAEAGKGAVLWVMLYPETVTMQDMVDSSAVSNAAPLLDAALGQISLLGVARKVTAETSVPGNFVFEDVTNAISVSSTMIENYRRNYKPFRLIIEGRIDNVAATPQAIKGYSNNGAAVVLGDTEAGIHASVGLALGRLSKIPVQRNIGRVKDGALVSADGYIGSTKCENVTTIENYIDNGYITLRTYIGRSGYYFSDDPMAIPGTDDYAILANGRVIDKAYKIAYQVYLNELNNEVPVDPETGQISPGTAKYLEGTIETQINTLMAGEISAFKAFVDPEQNVIATNTTEVNMEITPVGYSKKINITLGFTNPFN